MYHLAKVKQADEWYSRVVDKLLEVINLGCDKECAKKYKKEIIRY